MDKKWEDLQKKIQNDAENEKIEIPDTLKPENIETLLQSKEAPEQEKKKLRWKTAYTGIAAAACCALLIGGIFGGRFLVKNMVKMADDGTPDATQATGTPEGTIATAKDYQEIYEYLQTQEEEIVTYGAEESVMNSDAVASDSGADTSSAAGNAGTAKATAETDGGGYSDTNVREDGVGEADTVKTDGKYIYTLKDGMYLQIVDIQSAQMEVAATIDLSAEGQVSEFYLKDNQLYICYTDSGTGDYNATTNTNIKTYDISNPAEPKEIAQVSQSGQYDTMRVSGDYIYLISQLYVYNPGGAADDPRAYVPVVQGEALAADRIYMPVVPSGKQYTIISAINMNQPDEVCDTKALLSTSGMCYVSTESIYMCDQVYSNSEEYSQTSIRKVSYENGKLTAVGQTKVRGTLNDTFSIDEYDGCLRMVTTVTPQTRYNYGIKPIGSLKDFIAEDADDASEEKKQTNALYILDENLKQVSTLEGLAEDEQIYSARFLGDTAYFVTYKQVDPLFSVDLSNPKKPVILGELKIPGFSEYLHPYSENLLLGIGMDTDEDGLTTNGVKLSMFDITDPSNVSEVNKQVLKDVYGSNVFYDYKAVLIDAEKNLIGFSAHGDSQHYYVYSYDESSGFTCLLDHAIGNSWYGTIRGIYAGNTLYIVEGYAIESYDLTTFDKIDDIVL
ncbi:MAG: beta-propeller domain-containing protein [Hespellia sp.]|nr:beta-propeller domain-containing protein [Hespellia sp.]